MNSGTGNFRRLLPAIFLTFSLTLQLMGPAGYASASAPATQPFAGVTELEAHHDPASGEAVVTFNSDIPFHYQIQILGSDQVLFRLYHARLAQDLTGIDGALSLKSDAPGWSARLKNPPHARYPVSIEYQELILTAPALGSKKIRVQGATELPLTLGALPATPANPKITPKASHRSKALRHGRTQPGQAPLVKPERNEAQNTASRPSESRDGSHGLSGASSVEAVSVEDSPIVIPPAMRAQKPPPAKHASAVAGQRRGPVIESVRNTFSRNLPNLAAIANRPDESNVVYRLQLQPNHASAYSDQANRQAPGSRTALTIDNTGKLQPLPRYSGGGKPIRAVTLDEQGHPQMLRPKNDPLPEFDVSGDGDGYNVLFQAEGNDPPSGVAGSVGRLVSEALAAYHDRQPRQALQWIEQALRQETSNADLYAALGEIQWSLGRKDAALEAYRKAVNLASSPPSQYDRRYAQLLAASGKTRDAIGLLEISDRRHPHQAKTVYMLATLYEESGQTGPALERLKQAAQLDPASTDIQYKLGQAYELSGNAALAKQHYAEALKLSPDATDIQNALTRVGKDGS